MNKAKKFEQHVIAWQKKLGLLDWEIHVEGDTSKTSRAWVASDTTGMIATMFYDKKWIKKATDKEIERVAFHETVEVLCSPIQVKMEEFYADDYCQELTHRIIQVFENYVFGCDV